MQRVQIDLLGDGGGLPYKKDGARHRSWSFVVLYLLGYQASLLGEKTF